MDDLEAFVSDLFVFVVMTVIALAIITRAAKKSQLIENVVGI
jgi:hypothetical protein